MTIADRAVAIVGVAAAVLLAVTIGAGLGLAVAALDATYVETRYTASDPSPQCPIEFDRWSARGYPACSVRSAP